MNAVEFVEQIEKFDELMQDKRDEIKRLQDIALSITVSMDGEKVKSTPNPEKMASAVAGYLDLEAQLQLSIIQYATERQKVIGVLERLPTKEYKILYKKYVLMQDYQTIADAIGKSYSHVTSWHGIALAHLQKILDEESK